MLGECITKGSDLAWCSREGFPKEVILRHQDKLGECAIRRTVFAKALWQDQWCMVTMHSGLNPTVSVTLGYL